MTVSAREKEAARYVMEFMRRHAVDQLRLDDENHHPSYQLDFDGDGTEELDDAVAWLPAELVYNGPRGDRDPWNPVVRRADLEKWLD